MKKILFINPNHLWYTNQDAYLSKGQVRLRKIVPPLGIAYLASIIRKHDFEVNIIEANALNLSMNEAVSLSKKFEPDFIFLSSFFSTVDATLKLSSMLKKLFSVPLIVGGSDPTARPEEYIKHFDIVAIGEGENTILDILKNKSFTEIPGIVYLKNGVIKKNPEIKIEKNLDELPFPSWDLLPLEKYKPETMCIKYKQPLATVITSRGCKYNCSFCAAKVVFPKPRYRNINNVFEEIKNLYFQNNVKTLIFYDSTFTAKKERIIKLCNLLLKNKINLLWSMETRAEDVNLKLLKLMKAAGCYYINFGVETFNKTSLKAVNRSASSLKIKEETENCRKLGIITRLECILGLPYETKETTYKMFETMKIMNPDFVSYYPLLLLPETPLAKKNLKSILTMQELESLANKGYKKFYLRPTFLFSRLKHFYNLVYIKRYFDCFRGFLN